MRHQVRDNTHTGLQVDSGKHLHLVKQNNTVGNVVELPALGRAIGIKGFKKLHRSCHNYWSIPVFCCQPLEALGTIHFRIGVKARAGMMLNDMFLTQYFTKHRCILFDDRGVWNDIDDPLHLVFHCMLQSKRQRCNGLSAPRGNRQGIHSLGGGACFQASR